MPKKKKYPKQPKASASKATWDKWETKCKAVSAHNKEIAERPKKIAQIKERVNKLKAKY